MFLTQLEYRDKPTATNWRRMQLQKQMHFTSEDPALAKELLQIIASLIAFGTSGRNQSFHNGIARMTLMAAHKPFLWFCKNTFRDGTLLVDEEELYDEGDTLLMRRAFEEFTFADAPAGTIAIDQSMLAQHPELEVLQQLQRGFQRTDYIRLDEQTLPDIEERLQNAPHGTLLLLDAGALSAPLDLSAVTLREDLQLLCTNCIGIPSFVLERKGNTISLKQ